MKRIVVTGILLGSAASLASVNAALAADMDYVRPSRVHTTQVEYGSGWYLRGDIGFGLFSSSEGTYHSTTYGDDTSYASESINATESYTLGMGYVFNNFLRADVTLEHSNGIRWEGRSASASCGTAPSDCYFEADAELKRTSLLANGYVSLGHFRGFKPYIGGGLGLTNVSWSDYNFQQSCYVDPGEDCSFGSHSGGTGGETIHGPSGTVSTSSGMALTYALAAGVDYRLNNNWTIDLGYKWTHISENLMLKENANGIDEPAGDSSFNSINLHEVKVGLRYEVW